MLVKYAYPELFEFLMAQYPVTCGVGPVITDTKGRTIVKIVPTRGMDDFKIFEDGRIGIRIRNAPWKINQMFEVQGSYVFFEDLLFDFKEPNPELFKRFWAGFLAQRFYLALARENNNLPMKAKFIPLLASKIYAGIHGETEAEVKISLLDEYKAHFTYKDFDSGSSQYYPQWEFNLTTLNGENRLMAEFLTGSVDLADLEQAFRETVQYSLAGQVLLRSLQAIKESKSC